jgi:WD40 repeat protein
MREATGEPEQTLVPEGARDQAFSLAGVWGGRLISWHSSGKRVWNVVTSECDQVIWGQDTLRVCALDVCGSPLASGSSKKSVKLLVEDSQVEAAAAWTCERTLLGHTGWILFLTTWQGKVPSGSNDTSTRVRDARTGAHEATLLGHAGIVHGLVVHGHLLLSSSFDRAVVSGLWGRAASEMPGCELLAARRRIVGAAAAARQRERPGSVGGGRKCVGGCGEGCGDYRSAPTAKILR